jgi:hypothetical protein
MHFQLGDRRVLEAFHQHQVAFGKARHLFFQRRFRLAAQFVRAGSIAWLAQRLPAVVTVGRTGLVCFVSGTLVSLIVDTATPHTFHGFRGTLIGLGGDLVAIGAVLMIARGWNDWKGQQSRAAARRARYG